jgi:hypothetical protein
MHTLLLSVSEFTYAYIPHLFSDMGETLSERSVYNVAECLCVW